MRGQRRYRIDAPSTEQTSGTWSASLTRAMYNSKQISQEDAANDKAAYVEASVATS